MHTIRIEPICEEDLEGLLTLFREFSIFEKMPEKMTNSLEQMREEKEFLTGFVAKDSSGKILGYVTFYFAYYTWTGKSLYMDDLYVGREYRGQGLGSSLIRKVISYAKENKCRKLRWQVSHWNEPAIEFYKKLGAEISYTEMNCDLIF